MCQEPLQMSPMSPVREVFSSEKGSCVQPGDSACQGTETSLRHVHVNITADVKQAIGQNGNGGQLGSTVVGGFVSPHLCPPTFL